MKIYWNGTSKNIIGSKIRQLRQEKGLSQAALASQSICTGNFCLLSRLHCSRRSHIAAIGSALPFFHDLQHNFGV